MFHVTGCVPEARHIAEVVAEIYWRHTEPWFVGLTCFGSAVRGGFIPGVSDIDFHMYLKPEVFVEADGYENILPLRVGLAIHRDLSLIDPAPFSAIDGTAETDFIPEGHVGPIPGNYCLIAGRLPVAEATGQQVTEMARRTVAQIRPLPAFVSQALLRHGAVQGKLEPIVRRFSKIVWPVIYHVACLQQEDPLAVWRLPKDQVVSLISSAESLRQTAQAFDTAMQHYNSAEERSLDDALMVVASGVRFLEQVVVWRQLTPLPEGNGH